VPAADGSYDEAMRFRRRMGLASVVTWCVYASVVALAFYRTHHSPVSVAASAVVVLLLFWVPHLYWYWEILPDRLVHRRYFQSMAWPLAEIVYVGPVTGGAAGRKATRDWIEIRNAAGQRMIAQPGNPKAFLEEMRKHLPEITLEL
jgi:hypothetical protein